MNNSIYQFARPVNEPVKTYAKGTTERSSLQEELKRQASTQIEIPLIIGGKEIRTGKLGNVVMPHNHKHVLATYHKAGENEVKMAVDAAMKAKKDWYNLDWTERASIMLKAAELISKKYRDLLNAATMLGQSKSAYQAEIDSACETIDFLRFNNHFAGQIYSDQPHSDAGIINRLEYRPLEGFVFTISPFNFTAIAANLNTSCAIMGNTTVWKPATTALLSNYYLIKILQEAGLPDGVINYVPGQGSVLSNVVLNHRDFGGIHFTGSNNTFNTLWRTVANNLEMYKAYPKLVGETGGKDFVFAHSSAAVKELAVALVRGAFEYQGQKCSAASRAYIPKSIWPKVKEEVLGMIEDIKMGSPEQFENFFNAVIDEKAFDSIMAYIEKAKNASDAEIIAGGTGDKTEGYFIQPTVILTSNPHFLTMEEEIFGPVLTIYVYDDKDFEDTLRLCDETSPYALTGAVFANDKYAMMKASETLRFAAGNFYFNDKPTGAMVGQQPFGGSRGSGTNDKAGSLLNLIRWTNPRLIKETLVPPADYKYPFML